MKYPVTQAQYAEFVDKTGHTPPTAEHWPDYSWRDGRVPRGKENHPVVLVSFADAVAFCEWLSGRLGFEVRLPTEGEWEYATKGPQSGAERERAYPWGDGFDPEKCNTWESGIHVTSPVGIFPHGRRPDGPEEMAGNVWEWTSSLYKPYPYKPDDGREDPAAEGSRVLRGGSWRHPADHARVGLSLPAPRPTRTTTLGSGVSWRRRALPKRSCPLSSVC